MAKIARLRLEMKGSHFMLSKLYDIESGIAIPFSHIKIDVGVGNYRDGIMATVTIPIEEVDITDMLTEIITEADE